MAGKLMTPAHPPPPTNWNLPFQFSGSHASISISESEDGRSIALMRQCAGTICGGAAGGPPGPPRPLPSGAAGGAAAGPRPACRNGPAAIISAATIVALGSAIDFKPSHDAGEDARVAESARTAIIATSRSAGPREGGQHRTGEV